MKRLLLFLGGWLVISAWGNEPILPLPDPRPLSEAARLGERLFHDPRLSGSGRISCATCHRLDEGGDDGLPLPTVQNGSHPHNTPTVFNAAFNYRLHWYGDLTSLEQQARAALQRDMQVDWQKTLLRLKADTGYRKVFDNLFGGLTADSVVAALVAFENTLITPDAPLDRYLRGDTAALTPQQQRGYALFKAHGCSACHQGINVGGNLLQQLGVFGRYRSGDPGRIAVTGRKEDRNVFRVPSLRNVAVTAPYFHDGRVKTLKKAVELMAQYQLGIRMKAGEIDAIVAFLNSLTGRYHSRPIGKRQ